ncbi:hypothetical protein B0H11DRAFT_2250369 [Mycena galericulata]|nr:hypothetical protein B0H11DRAFT_2250369 [Mycena galericulata]
MKAAPCAAVFGASELCASIIDFLCESVHDLKSCALVSHQFTFLAQSHLFQVVDLDVKSPQERPRRSEDAAARLGKIMQQTPHLRLLVRTLYAPIEEAVLMHVVNMRLDRLNRLTLTGGLASTAAVSLARDLLALPSLEWLTLFTSLSNCGDLGLLFSRCTAALCTLDIFYLRIHPGIPGSDMPRGSGRRAKITSLCVSILAPEIIQWFLGPHSPFDFSQLQQLELYHSVSPMLAFVPLACRTIEELRLDARDITPGLPLSDLPALKTLRLVGDPPTLRTALDTLPMYSDRLEVITLAARSQIIDIDVLAPLDTVLAGRSLPALKRVEVSVARLHHSLQDSLAHRYTNYDSSVVVPAFKEMHAQGLLVVQHDREWGKELEGRLNKPRNISSTPSVAAAPSEPTVFSFVSLTPAQFEAGPSKETPTFGFKCAGCNKEFESITKHLGAIRKDTSKCKQNRFRLRTNGKFGDVTTLSSWQSRSTVASSSGSASSSTSASMIENGDRESSVG